MKYKRFYLICAILMAWATLNAQNSLPMTTDNWGSFQVAYEKWNVGAKAETDVNGRQWGMFKWKGFVSKVSFKVHRSSGVYNALHQSELYFWYSCDSIKWEPLFEFEGNMSDGHSHSFDNYSTKKTIPREARYLKLEYKKEETNTQQIRCDYITAEGGIWADLSNSTVNSVVGSWKTVTVSVRTGGLTKDIEVRASCAANPELLDHIRFSNKILNDHIDNPDAVESFNITCDFDKPMTGTLKLDFYHDNTNILTKEITYNISSN